MDNTLYEQLIASVYRFVSFRPRSEKEFREFLQKKLHASKTFADPSVIEKVMVWLADHDYLNDGKFAQWLYDQRTGSKPRGTKLIEQELRQKGIEKSVIDQVLGSAGNQVDLARVALAKKIHTWQAYPSLVIRKKASDFLLRRGFSWDTVSAVVDELLTKQ
jgi:regulatory protein